MMSHLVSSHSLHRIARLVGTASVALLLAVAPGRAQSAPLSVTTVAGAAGVRQAIDGSALTARFYEPTGVVLDAQGNLVIADSCNNLIRKMGSDSSATVSTLAGTPMNTADNRINIGHDDGAGGAAKFYMGQFVSGGLWSAPVIDPNVGAITLGLDSQGNIYVADTQNDTIRKVTSAGVVTTIAGAAGSSGSADGSGSDARFSVPGGVTADASGNVYVADSGNNAIRKLTVSGTTYTSSTLAGGSFGTQDGTGTAARFSNPSGIAIDANGNLYVADTGNHAIRKVTAAGVVTTLAGSPGVRGTSDGTGTQARFNGPTGIAVDATGNVYVADTGNHAIRMISPGGTVTTVAGLKGTAGADDGTGTAARFNGPYGITVSSNGTVYIADTGNQTIRKAVVSTSSGSLQVTSTPPSKVQVNKLANVTLKITATGTPSPTYQWSKDGVAISGATNSSLSLTSVTTANAGTYNVLVTSDQATYSSSGTQLQVFDTPTPTVVPVAIVSEPVSRTVAAGQSTTFAVEAASTGTLTYQWAKNGTPITGATASTYTVASAQGSDAADYTVTVNDGVNAAATTDAATLTVTGVTNVAPSFTTQPLSQSVAVGATVTLSAAASGTPAPTYKWQKDGVDLTNGGTISGATTATLTLTNVTSADAGTYKAVATNSVAATLSNGATLTVGPVITPSNRGRIINMSVRTDIAVGEEMTFGFFTGGDGTTGSKSILMRAMGPSLGATFNIPNTLGDPYAKFFNSSTLVDQNDNWGGDQTIATAAAAVGAFPFISASSKDAAVYRTDVTAATGHSLLVSGANGTSGNVIAELYDTTASTAFTATTPRLINVSVRKIIGVSTTVGFVIDGSSPVKILIRAVGPTLGSAFNIPGVMADPQIAVYHGGASTSFATNNDWAGNADVTDAMHKTGAFDLPAASKDAAIVLTLDPGSYTAQVSAATGATGVALIDIYEVP